ncbi:hypothetical protein [Flavobacterium sp.]|jgi:hypothetical protein|uniref:hypothetical protein n=1 Tax=Flavobacterium sp. TaxID=239 RepID=UPI0037BE8F6C
MKNNILLLTMSLFFLSCSSDSNPDNNNSVDNNNNIDYDFSIKINGITHNVQGNTDNFGENNLNMFTLNPNNCYAQVGTTTILRFTVADITRPNFITGQNLEIQLSIPNCHVGENEATLSFLTSPVLDAFRASLNGNYTGATVENSGLYCSIGAGSSCTYPQLSNNKITINITDMGSSTIQNTGSEIINDITNYGNTLKGNFSGPLYVSTDLTGSVVTCTTPLQFSMSFSAYRVN